MHARRPSRRAQTLRWRCSCTMKSRKRLSAAAGKRPATRRSRSRSRRPRPPEPGSPARQVRPGPMDPRGRDNRMQTLLDVRRRLPPLQAPLSLTKAGLYASLADAPLDECLSIPCWGIKFKRVQGIGRMEISAHVSGPTCSCLCLLLQKRGLTQPQNNVRISMLSVCSRGPPSWTQAWQAPQGTGFWRLTAWSAQAECLHSHVVSTKR